MLVHACSVCYGSGVTMDGKPCPCGCMTINMTRQGEEITSLRQRVAELEAVLREIRLVAPREVECNSMHHAKKDRHAFDESCPVVSRYAEAIAKIDEVLK